MRSRMSIALVALAVFSCGLLYAPSVISAKNSTGLSEHTHILEISKSVPAQLNYQGFLASASDSSAVTATLEMTFRLYDSEEKGVELWSETHPAIEINNGLFQVLLGSVTVFPDGLFDGSDMWLQTEAGMEILAPRKQLVSVAYSRMAGEAAHAVTADEATTADQAYNAVEAQHAVHADTAAYSPSVAAWTVSGDDVYRETGNVGIGTASPAYPLDVSGNVHAAAYYGDGSNLTGISGTTDNDWTISGDDVYHFTGNVGIGTASPVAKLHVDSEGNTEVKIEHDDVSNLISLYADTHRTGYLEKNDDDERLYLSADGSTDQVTILESSGNVGIGTISPAAKLDVNGDVNTDSLYKIGGTTVLSTEGLQNVFVGAGAGGNNTGGWVTFVGASAGQNNQGNDNVFVGRRAGYSNTTGGSSTYLGQAAGYSNNDGSENTFLGSAAGYKNTAGSQNTYLGRHAGYSNITGTGNVFIGCKAGYYETGSDKLYIANSSAKDAALISGDFSTGRVGIGKTSPSAPLDVSGYVNADLGGGGGVALKADGLEAVRVSSPGAVSYFTWGYGATANYFPDPIGIGTTDPVEDLDIRLATPSLRIAADNNSESSLQLYEMDGSEPYGFELQYEGDDDNLSLWSRGFGTFDYRRMVWQSNGNVAIGTEFAGSQLTVVGGDETGIGASCYSSTHPALSANNELSGPSLRTYHGDIEIYFANDKLGYDLPDGYRLYVSGSAYCTGSWSSSDGRYKRDIRAVEDPLEKVCDMRGVSFIWNTGEYPDRGFSEGRHYGVIAQELEKVLPKSVKEDSRGDKAVAYDEIIPVLIEAVKELSEENDLLKSRIEALEKR